LHVNSEFKYKVNVNVRPKPVAVFTCDCLLLTILFMWAFDPDHNGDQLLKEFVFIVLHELNL
jgi:hypothetical protein